MQLWPIDLLEFTGAVSRKGGLEAATLGRVWTLEKERGITIKSHAIQMELHS